MWLLLFDRHLNYVEVLLTGEWSESVFWLVGSNNWVLKIGLVIIEMSLGLKLISKLNCVIWLNNIWYWSVLLFRYESLVHILSSWTMIFASHILFYFLVLYILFLTKLTSSPTNLKFCCYEFIGFRVGKLHIWYSN